MRLEGKVAIITGGGSGIGRASAELFAREGAKVVVAEYKADTGREAVRAIKDAGGEAIFVEVDVSDSAQVQAVVQTALDTYGGIDILFNNAGVLLFGTILDTDEKAWNWLMSIHTGRGSDRQDAGGLARRYDSSAPYDEPDAYHRPSQYGWYSRGQVPG